MTVRQQYFHSWGIAFFIVLVGMVQTLSAEPIVKGLVTPVQVPYEAPPKGQDLSAESVPQNTKSLTAEEEIGRAHV